MDLRELANFIKIVELGSLSRAAEVLHVAQPALGAQVRNLEAELQQKLLIRHSRGVEPTEAGSVLMGHAKAILDQVAQAKRALAEMKDPSGTVSIGMTASANHLLFQNLYEATRDRFPNITLNVVEALSAALVHKLAEGEIEIACIHSQAPVKGLVLEPLLADEWVFVSPLQSRPPKDEIAFEQVLEYPLLIPSRSSGMRKRLEAAAAERGTLLKVVLEVESEPLMKDLIRKKLGHTILPYASVRDEEAGCELHCARIVSPRFPSRTALAYSDKRPLSRGAATVRDVLLQLTAADASSGPPLKSEEKREA